MREFQVKLEGEIYEAPFSKKVCVWYDWLYRDRKENPLLESFTYGDRTDSLIIVQSETKKMMWYPDRINPYLLPSFQGVAIIEGQDVIVEEFCLEMDLTYYAAFEKFSFPLPPILFLPIRRAIKLLAISDAPFIGGQPPHPLIPTYRGRSGGK